MSAVWTEFAVGRRRVLSAIAVGAAALVALPFVGGWEDAHDAAAQNARMAEVYRLATSDGLISKRLDAYRLDAGFDCLLYQPPGRPEDVTALELCFGPQGRLVETIDRRGNPPRIASLQAQPDRTSLRLPVPALEHAFRWVTRDEDPRLKGRLDGSSLPVGFDDIGALGRPPAPKRRRPGR